MSRELRDAVNESKTDVALDYEGESCVWISRLSLGFWGNGQLECVNRHLP